MIKKLNEVKAEPEEALPVESGIDSSSEGKVSDRLIEEQITEAAKPETHKKSSSITKKMEMKQLKEDSAHNSFEERKDSSDLNMDQEEIQKVQRVVNDYMERIKKRLRASNKKIGDLIEDHIVTGEIDGTECEVVPIEELMEIVKDISSNEFSEGELRDIEEIFKELGISDYVFVESLLEFFAVSPTSTS